MFHEIDGGLYLQYYETLSSKYNNKYRYDCHSGLCTTMLQLQLYTDYLTFSDKWRNYVYTIVSESEDVEILL